MSVIEIDYNCIVDSDNQLIDYARPTIKAIKDVGHLIVIRTKEDPEWIAEYLTLAMIPFSSINYVGLEVGCIMIVSKISNTVGFSWQTIVAHYSGVESASKGFKKRYMWHMQHESSFNCPTVMHIHEMSHS